MLIIKAGGGADINLEGIAADLAGLTEPFVVVLGANALRDRVAGQLGQAKVELTSVSGYTSVYSDQDAIDLIMMSYAGLRNRRFVEMCQRQGSTRWGLPAWTAGSSRVHEIAAFACATKAKPCSSAISPVNPSVPTARCSNSCSTMATVRC